MEIHLLSLWMYGKLWKLGFGLLSSRKSTVLNNNMQRETENYISMAQKYKNY